MSNTCQAQQISSYAVQSIGTKQRQRPHFQYLIARNNILYFRISVPYSLREVFNKSEIRYSLRTSYLRQARTRSLFLASRIKSIFEYAKKAISMDIELNRNELNELLHSAYDQSIRTIELEIHGEVESGELKTKDDIETYLSKEAEYAESNIYSNRVTGTAITNFDVARKLACERQCDDGLDIENIAGFIFNAIPTDKREDLAGTIYKIAEMIKQESTFSIFKQSGYIQDKLRELSCAFARIEALAYRQHINKLHGLFDYSKAHKELDKTYPRQCTVSDIGINEKHILNSLDRMIQKVSQNVQSEKTRSESTEKVSSELRTTSPTLGQAIEEYKQTIPKTEWGSSYNTALSYPLEYFDKDILLSDITGDMISGFAWNYMNFPHNRRNNPDYKGVHIKDLAKIELARENRLKYGTVNGYLERVVTLFKTVSIQKHFNQNEHVLIHLTAAKGKIVDLLKKEQGGKKSRVKPFNSDDLSALFNITSFNDILDSKNDLAWAMLITLYTGMRSGEIAGLRPSDIKTTPQAPLYNESGAPYRDGITYIDLSYSNVKNENSQRLIPLNSFLLKDLRLKDFFDSRHNSEWIFPSFVNKAGEKDDAISKSFTDYRRKANVGRSKDSNRFDIENKVLHSFRHTFKHRCKALGLRFDLVNKYVGHGGSKIEGEPTYNHELGIDSLFDNVAERLDFHTWIPQIGALVDTMKKIEL